MMENRLKEIRETKGMTLEKVAELAGTTNQQVHRLETGKRKLTVQWVERLAKALNVKPSEIVPDLAPLTDPWEQEMLDKLRGLNDEGRQAFEAMIQAWPKK